MPSVLVVLSLKSPYEQWHFDSRDKPPSPALRESRDAHSRICMILRHKPCYLPPVEHLANHFEDAIRGIRVPRTHRGVNGLDVGADDGCRGTRLELRKDSAFQTRFVVFPGDSLLLRVVLNECRAELGYGPLRAQLL